MNSFYGFRVRDSVGRGTLTLVLAYDRGGFDRVPLSLDVA